MVNGQRAADHHELAVVEFAKSWQREHCDDQNVCHDDQSKPKKRSCIWGSHCLFRWTLYTVESFDTELHAVV